MVRLAIILSLVLCACLHGGPKSPTNTELAVSPGTDRAVALIASEWTKRLGPPAPSGALPRVRWFEGYHAEDGRCCYIEFLRAGAPARVYSQFWPASNEVFVTAVTSDRPSGTGLAHEMLHWALITSGRDGDAKHTLPIWTQVSEVNQLLQDRGL